MNVSSSKKTQRISLSVLLLLSHYFALYLALTLSIMFTSLAFQKSYLYESCVAGALVSLSLLGYETGETQPARLSSGLWEDISHPPDSKNKLSQMCRGRNTAGWRRERQGLQEIYLIPAEKVCHCSMRRSQDSAHTKTK